MEPLEHLSDVQLYNTQIALALACGRARSAIKKRHRTDLCFLFGILRLEADKRGKASPTPPFTA